MVEEASALEEPPSPLDLLRRTVGVLLAAPTAVFSPVREPRPQLQA